MSYPKAITHSQGKSTRFVTQTHTYRQIRLNLEADTALLGACRQLAGKEPGDLVSCSMACRRAVMVYADYLKHPDTNLLAEMQLVRERSKMPKRKKR